MDIDTQMDCARHINTVVRDMQQRANVNTNVVIEFGTARRSYHKMRNGRHVVVFGEQSVEYAYTHGFIEYPTIADVWRGVDGIIPNTTFGAVTRLVLHELAHVVQTDNGERRYGVVHDWQFAMELHRLIGAVAQRIE